MANIPPLQGGIQGSSPSHSTKSMFFKYIEILTISRLNVDEGEKKKKNSISYASVVQRIEQGISNPPIWVRFPVGVQ